jgi:hypothetical protein
LSSHGGSFAVKNASIWKPFSGDRTAQQTMSIPEPDAEPLSANVLVWALHCESEPSVRFPIDHDRQPDGMKN